MDGHHNRDTRLFTLKQSSRRDKRIQIVHIDDIRALILQNPAHLPNPFRAVQTSQESMNLTHKRIPATGRRHSQLHDLMAVLCPHGCHLIDNSLFTRILSVIVMN